MNDEIFSAREFDVGINQGIGEKMKVEFSAIGSSWCGDIEARFERRRKGSICNLSSGGLCSNNSLNN